MLSDGRPTEEPREALPNQSLSPGRRPAQERAEEMGLRDAIQKIAIEMPAYGYRRITAHLHRDNRVVNHKRVLRLMREDNLLCLRRRAFVRTTDLDHKLPVYPNLA